MSTVDERVVRMQFDNKQFEAGVSATMSTLAKLKDALSFKSGGLSELQNGINSVSMDPLSGQIVTVQQQFSFLGELARVTFDRISSSIIDTATRIGKAVTIEPITAGFQEYETQMDAVQTIMANTQAAFADVSNAEHLGAVNGALDELNTYADKTIYNFTEMTRNIGTFTAAGVGLDTAKTSIQGIANMAAVSGSTSQQASTAMYQLSQAIASGSVKLQDWNSVVNAGMGGQVFQDALKKTAREHGVAVDSMIEKNGSFRESLKEGWITSEILTETLSKMTDVGLSEYLAEATDGDKEWIQSQIEAIEQMENREDAVNELSAKLAESGKISQDEAKNYLDLMLTAQDAATKVKTFSQLIDTVKEGLGSGWTQSIEYIIGDFEEAKQLWSDIYKEIDSIIAPIANARNEMLKFWHDNGGRKKAIEAIGNVWDGVKAVMGEVGKAWSKVFPPMTGKKLLDITKNVAKLTEGFKKIATSQPVLWVVRNLFEGIFSVIKMGIGILKTAWKITAPFRTLFGALVAGILSITSAIGWVISHIREATSSSAAFFGTLKALGDHIHNVFMGIAKTCDNVLKKVLSFFNIKLDNLPFTNFVNSLSTVFSEKIDLDSIKATFDSIVGMISGFKLPSIESIGSYFSSFIGSFAGVKDAVSGGVGAINPDSLSGFAQGFYDATIKIEDVASRLKNAFNTIKESPDGFAPFAKAKEIISGLSGVLSTLWTNVKSIASQVGSNIIEFLGIKNLDDLIDKAKAIIGLWMNFNFAKILGNVNGMTEGLSESFESVAGVIKKVTSSIGGDDDKSSESFTSKVLKIAIALGILAGSLAVLANIDSDKLAMAFDVLVITMFVATKALKSLSDATNAFKAAELNKLATALVKMVVAIRVLVSSIKALSKLTPEQAVTGVLATGAAMAIMVAGAKALAKNAKGLDKSATGIIAFAVAMRVLVMSVKSLGKLGANDPAGLAMGLAGVWVLMEAIKRFMQSFNGMNVDMKGVGKVGLAVFAISGAIKRLAKAAATLAELNFSQLVVGLGGVIGILAALTIAAKYLNGTQINPATSLALVAMAFAIGSLAKSVQELSIMAMVNWPALVLGVGSIVALVFALSLGSANMVFAAGALIILTAALALLVPTLHSLEDLTWETLLQGIAKLAVAFVALGAVAVLFGVFAAPILMGAAALQAFGIACLTIGAGVLLAAAGIGALALAVIAGAAPIAAGVAAMGAALLVAIPLVAAGFAAGIVAFATTLANCWSQVLVALDSVIHSTGDFLLSNIPYLQTILSTILTAVFAVIAEAVPPLLAMLTKVVAALLVWAVGMIPILANGLVQITVTLMNSVANAIRDNQETIFAAIRNILSSLAELVLEAIAQMLSLIPGVGDSLAEGVRKGKDIVQETLAPETLKDTTKGAMEGAAEGVKEGGKELQNAAEETGEETNKSFSDMLGDGKEAVTGFIGDATSAMMDGSGDMADGGEMLGGIFNENFANLDVANAAGVDLTNANLEGIMSNIDAYGGAGGEQLDAYLNIFGNTGEAKAAGEKVSEAAAEGEASQDKAHEEASKANQLAYNRYMLAHSEEGKTAGKLYAMQVVNGETSTNPEHEKAAESNRAAYNAKLAKDEGISSSGAAMSKTAAEGEKSQDEAHAAASASNVNAYKLAMKAQADQIKASATEVAKRAAEGEKETDRDHAKSAESNVSAYSETLEKDISSSNAAMKMSKGAASAAGTQTKAWSSAATPGINAYKHSLGKGSAASQGASLARSGANGAGNQRGSYEGAGKNLGYGFANGIIAADAVAAAVSHAATLAARALQAIKDKLKVNSPSKETMMYGEWFSEGFAIGIENLSMYAQKSASTMGEKTLKALSVSADEIVNYAKMDYDIDPTIKPVMDLTEIQNGVNKANSMVGSIGGQISLGLGNASYARDIYNGMSASPRDPMRNLAITLAEQNAQNMSDMMQSYSSNNRQMPEKVEINVYGVTGPDEVADAVGRKMQLLGLV